MRNWKAAVAGVLMAAAATVAASEARAQTVGAQTAADGEGEIRVSLDRVRRNLDRVLSAPANAGRRLRLNDYVTVYARLPALDLIEPSFSLTDGPVPNGPPTRREMLNAMTPREWRSQGVNLSNVIGWTVRRINAAR